MRYFALCVIVYMLIAVPGWCGNVCTGDLSELADFGKLAYLRDSVCTQVSSFDRTGANDDGPSGKYSFLRMENGKQVIFDSDGPGCIYRIWNALASDQSLEFYFDGSDKPGLVFNSAKDMFQNKTFPFVHPLSQFFIGGWCSYVPIPFAKHCKIVAGGGTHFYQITWHKFPSAEGVKTFSTDYSDEYKAKFEQVKKLWTNPGTAPWGETLPQGWKTYEADVVIKPGKSGDLAKLSGAGVVRALYITADCDDTRFYRKCILEANVDSQPKPNVWTPIGDLFLDGFGWPAGKSALTGKLGDSYYCYWPMPYASAMSIRVSNDASQDIKIHCRAIVEPMDSLPKDMGRFYAWWHQQDPTRMGKGFEMLTATGRGHFCGVNNYMQGSAFGVSFLEGDEMAWIDDRDNTYYNGTGTEDYFNGGYYFNVTGSAPLYGCLSLVGGTVDAYRYQTTDLIPFQQKARIEIEHGGRNTHPINIEGTTFWYGEPGLTHTFDKVSVEDRLLPPRIGQDAIEVDRCFIGGGPDVEIRGSDGPYHEYSEVTAVCCTAKDPGGWIRCRTDFEATSQYEIRAQVGCGPDFGKLAVFVDDKQVGDPVDCYSPDEKLQVKTLATCTPEILARVHTVTFRVVGKNEKATGSNAIVDTMFLRRVGLIEGERMKLTSSSAKTEIQMTAALDGSWSGDSQVLLTGGKGSWYEFDMPVAKTERYRIGAYFMKAPDGGMVRLLVDGKEVAGDVDLYSGTVQRSDMMRYGGAYELAAGSHKLRIEIIGKRDESKGYRVGLDAISLERNWE